MSDHIRNIAIIAHVDHGKTTLVDQLLRQSGTMDTRGEQSDRLMDSNDLERERGITILSKNTAIQWNEYRINIVDTPGHADFGGEVERVLSMVDSVLLLVDAVDGPMPQTRFVTQKAFALNLKPIVVINKIDRPGARPEWVLDQTFDLFDRLGASDEQLDFPVVYTSALQGYARLDPCDSSHDMRALFETIVRHVPSPVVDPDGALQMQISSLAYDSYKGVIGAGRISRGSLKRNTPVVVVGRDGSQRSARVLQILGYLGLTRQEVDQASAGDIVAVTGIDDLGISQTLCAPGHAQALAQLSVDEPTMSMTFEVNKSTFAGRDGKFITSRQIGERLERELKTNVALRVTTTDDPDRFNVSGRGLLHLGILIENMRREGYEIAIGRPRVIVREIDGVSCEPFEELVVDVEEGHQGNVIENLAQRKGEMQSLVPDGRGRIRMVYRIPSRGLIGFQTEFLSATSGTGLMVHVFDSYQRKLGDQVAQRSNGVLISNGTGKALAYALFNLQDRGSLMVAPGDEIYEGMVVGIHSRNNDLVVNPLKAKQLTNVRAAGRDENINLAPPVRLSLEQALEFINDDELVEVTPAAIRLHKRYLSETERKRAARG